ncbi:hypothetical protein LRS73_12445 [Methylobacterium currus]|uniref:hypothetical protein n=1 Tax=Methylobacterium currus TaxID=2051553 RepID=UPI001E2CBC89|nr:hypothetical protein [Methylobacterium currus]UHC18579.1 hypothetical protein LRS73_12445 [Methylobacterium currus]
MLKTISILLIAAIYGASPAAAEDWPRGPGCGFANLGGCRKSIEIGEHFTASNFYAFRRPSDLQAWRERRKKDFSEKTKHTLPIELAEGVLFIEPDAVMLAKGRLPVCCPGGAFEGVVEHPELGEIYIINFGRF